MNPEDYIRARFKALLKIKLDLILNIRYLQNVGTVKNKRKK